MGTAARVDETRPGTDLLHSIRGGAFGGSFDAVAEMLDVFAEALSGAALAEGKGADGEKEKDEGSFRVHGVFWVTQLNRETAENWMGWG